MSQTGKRAPMHSQQHRRICLRVPARTRRWHSTREAAVSRADELIRLLQMSADYRDGNPDRCHITGLEHMLRCATLAGTDREATFTALIHDAARPLSDAYHGEVIAEIVRDRVSENAYGLLRTHGTYQAQLVHGTPVDEQAPWHDAAVALCRWEAASFAPNWVRLTLSLTEARRLIHEWMD